MYRQNQRKTKTFKKSSDKIFEKVIISKNVLTFFFNKLQISKYSQKKS